MRPSGRRRMFSRTNDRLRVTRACPTSSSRRRKATHPARVPPHMIDDALRTALADRYRIEREIGAGGMATVYLAEDLKHRRKVALKVLRPELSAQLGPERFLHEIALTASLQNPHIVPLFDSGAIDGQLFYVMPYVNGETLRARIARGPVPMDESLGILRDISRALAYAHAQGVVHRDIKPDNVLLSSARPSSPTSASPRRSANRATRTVAPRTSRSRAPALRSAPPPTCPPSRRSATPSMRAPTSTRGGSSPTSCSPVCIRSPCTRPHRS